MCIDREQHKSCPQVLLSCSLRPCQVIQASEVNEFPGQGEGGQTAALELKETVIWSWI